jgi:hypothetical protein
MALREAAELLGIEDYDDGGKAIRERVKALLEQALEALTHIETCIHGHEEIRLRAINAIRAALAAQPQTLDEAMAAPLAMARAYENGYNAAWQAATAAERDRMEKHCAELSEDAYNRWRASRNPYDEGQCDAASVLGDKIRSGE